MARNRIVSRRRGFLAVPRWLSLPAGALMAAWMLAGAGQETAAERTTATASNVSQAGLTLTRSEPWTPESLAAPNCRQTDELVQIDGNATRTSVGGWQFVYGGIRPGQAYRIRAQVQHRGLDHPRDALVAIVSWHAWNPKQSQSSCEPFNYLLPRPIDPGTIAFENVLTAPPGAASMTVRYTLRWAEQGRTRWTRPDISLATVPEKKPVKICILAATNQTPRRTKIEPFSKGLDLTPELAGKVDLWASMVQAACLRKPQLIVTPEVAISGRKLVEGSIAVPGPATAPFEQLARRHQVHLILCVSERERGAFYNTAVLIGPQGTILGRYRKVHLATSEGLSGASPGDGFPVFDTPFGRIGCLICMDTMLCESTRMLALGGADFVCLSIMGDLRADRFSPGPPIYQEDRWRAIMRTRAIDNQVTMVIARNSAQGSCVIDPKGDIVAWNEGDQDLLEVTLPPDPGRRSWDGADFREVTHILRRPHLYKPYTEEFDLKPLRAPETARP